MDRIARDLLHRQISNFPNFTDTQHAARLREFERTALDPRMSTVARAMRLELCRMRSKRFGASRQNAA